MSQKGGRQADQVELYMSREEAEGYSLQFQVNFNTALLDGKVQKLEYRLWL